MQVAPGIHRIGSDVIAAYLVVTDAGITMVDAGVAGFWDDLVAELAGIGAELADIRGMVLTHGDPDHIGIADRVRRASGARVHLHPADERHARTGLPRMTRIGRPSLRHLADTAPWAVRKGILRRARVADTIPVADGDVLDLPGAPVIVATPGHSPGSVSVHVPEVGALFVGDALSTRNALSGVEGPRLAAFTGDVEQATASLARLAPLDAQWVLPGHGAPWRGTPADAVAAALERRR